MNNVTLENFRCFRGRQSARLAPLTLLVGENSTGKTSFMALLRALWDAAYRGAEPDFKEAPYDLGSFEEIAHHRGGRGGRAHEFTAGFEVAISHRPAAGRQSDFDPDNPFVHVAFEPYESSHRFEITFRRKGTAPAPIRWLLEREGVKITSHVADDRSQEIRYRTPRGEWSRQVPTDLGVRLAANRLFFRSTVLIFHQRKSVT